MFPLYDINTSRKPHPVTIALIVINLALLAYELHLNSSHTLEDFLYKYGMVSVRFLDNPNLNELFTLVSSTFLHAGLFHCLGNMWFLWIFGDNVEEHLGSVSFLFFYLFCGFSADIISLVADPSATIPTIGASGAIAGVLGGYIVLHPEAKVVTTHPIFGWFKPITIPAYWFLGIWFGMNLISGWASFLSPSLAGGVAWWAHIGGFLGGALFASFMPRIESTKHDKSKIVEYSFGHQAFTLLFLSLVVASILTWQIQLHKFRLKQCLPAFTVASATIDADLSKSFKQQHGWLGTNRAFSISLNKKQSLWLFGHSWIQLTPTKKSTATLIDNAAAWQNLEKPVIPVQFFWSSNNKKPAALLKVLKLGRRYEPVSSVIIGGKLYVFARRWQIASPAKLEGIDLLCIANPQDKPTLWKIRQIPLPEGVRQLRLGSTCVVQNNYLYVYGTLPATKSSCNLVLGRVPTGDLSNNNSEPNWQYCGHRSKVNKRSNWTNDYQDAVALATELPEELAISQINDKIGFVATYLKPQSCEIMLRQATNPEGPWSTPLKAFDCRTNKAHLVPYEAINHPELASKPDELVVSYFSDCRPQQNRQIPNFVRIVLSEPGKSKTELCRLSRNF